MSKCSRIAACALLGLASGFHALAADAHGPVKGYLIITGGAPDFKHFLELAGGAKARIVVVPTAGITVPNAEAMLPPYCAGAGPFAGVAHCAVMHTIDRKVADSPEFAAPLKDATGIWLEGGRQWRLADAYLGTLTLKEMFNLLDRGGVIGGGSAGASIQASYMVRGSSSPDDNTIMMAPGHEVGFGFFRNTAIDQHVDARGRENDMAVVMKAHPELLGIGLDQSTSITVHGDALTVNGPDRVAIWDGKEHDGRGYFYLRIGDSLNTVTRVATVVEHPPETIRKEVTLTVEALARYAGKYEARPGTYMVVTVEREQLISQSGAQPKVPLFAESDGKFFAKLVKADFEFVKDANGRVGELILHQNGSDVPMRRLSDAELKQMAADAAAKAAFAAQRYKGQQAQTGSLKALRQLLEDLRASQPKYEQMTAEIAQSTRQQAARLKMLLDKLGGLQSIEFAGVLPDGADDFVTKFENGGMEWRILLAPDGKIQVLGNHPL